MRVLNARWSPFARWFAVGAVTAAVAALHVLVLHRQDFADDLFFATALEDRSVWDYLSFRYTRWTGRVPIEFMLVSVVNRVWLWKLLNISMFMLLAFSLARLGIGSRRVAGSDVALAACLILLVTPDILWWSAWWLTGSVNYLWPTALGAFALSVYLHPVSPRSWQVAAALVGASIAAYSEQVSIALLAIAGATLAWRWIQRATLAWHYLFVLVVAFNAAIAFAAPGNANRFAAEHATWFPDFAAIGVADKLNIGLGLVSSAVLGPGNWLLLLAAILACLVLARSDVPGVVRLSVLPGLLWIVSCQVIGMLGYQPGWRFGFPLSPASASRPIAYAVMVVSVYSLACLISAAAVSPAGRPGPREQALGFAMAVGMGTLLLLGWVPTSMASGSRTAFVFMTVVVVVSIDMLTRLREGASRNMRIAYWSICLAVSVGAVMRMQVLLVDAS